MPLVNDVIQAKFQSYIDEEEARLAANLDAVDYDIDAADTLVLVTGPDRIEKVRVPQAPLRLAHSFLVPLSSAILASEEAL